MATKKKKADVVSLADFREYQAVMAEADAQRKELWRTGCLDCGTGRTIAIQLGDVRPGVVLTCSSCHAQRAWDGPDLGLVFERLDQVRQSTKRRPE